MSSTPPPPLDPLERPAPSPRPFSAPARPPADAPVESIDDDLLNGLDAEAGGGRPLAPGSGGFARTLDTTGRRYYLQLSPPRLTYALIIACLMAFVLAIWVGWSRYGILNGFESIEVLVLLGAKVNQFIAQGEWWRLFTAMFLHVGILHLIFNMYAIFAIGPLVEGYYGSLRFALIYLIGGLFGSLASYAFSPSISAGASGAVFAIAAAAAVYFFRYRENFGARGRAILQNMLVVLGANLVFGIIQPGIDNWGHFGGMVGGLALGWALLPHYAPPAVARTGNDPLPVLPSAAPLRLILATLIALGLLWLGTTTATAHWQCGSWLGC